MQAALSKEQISAMWEILQDDPRVNLPIVTVDRWGDPFMIFEGWGDVDAVRNLALQLYPEICADCPERATVGDYPQIDYLVGEFGFSDEYSTCAHCGAAIHTEDYNPDHWLDLVAYEYVCGDCVRSDFGAEYLAYMAQRLDSPEDSAPILTRLADPDKYGFVCVNSRATELYCAVDNPTDHPDYDSRLTYGDYNELRRLGRAAQLIDPDLQIVYAYTGGSNRIWARLDPDTNRDFAVYDGVNGWDWEREIGDDTRTIILSYVLSLVFRKYGELYTKAHKLAAPGAPAACAVRLL